MGSKAGSGPDAVVGGWYINLGITGARAKLTEKNLKSLVKDEAKLQINAGRAFYEALSKVKDQQTEALTAKNKKAIQDPLDPLNKFIKKFQGQRYAEVAQKIVDELTKYPLALINPNNFFKVTEDAKTVK